MQTDNVVGDPQHHVNSRLRKDREGGGGQWHEYAYPLTVVECRSGRAGRSRGRTALGQHFRISRFSAAQAVIVAQWEYPPPYDIYSSKPSLLEDLLEHPGDGIGYFVLTVYGSEAPLGFCCYGPEACVPNEPDPGPGTLDIGGGLAPDAVSRGLATRYMPSILEHGIRLHNPEWLRVAVAAFNTRSLSLCRSAGFVERSRFEGPGEREFVALYRRARGT